MPKFSGSNDPEDYLSWALKVDKIFRLQNYDEEEKVAMASLEFQDYVLIWWEQVIARRQEKGESPITTWTQMKDVMRARFVPTHYSRDLFKKLQLLKQGTKSVEEYYKEMEIAMIRANVKEDDEQTIARFLNGLNHPIKKIADFQPPRASAPSHQSGATSARGLQVVQVLFQDLWFLHSSFNDYDTFSNDSSYTKYR